MSNRKGTGTIVVICVVVSVVSSLVTGVIMRNNFSNSKTENTPSQIVVNDTGKTQNIYHAVSDKAMPSVVGITTVSLSESNMFAIPSQTEGVGTGVIVDANGYILTNSHVVDDGEALDVKVLFNDGTTMKGRVLWNDAQLDLAMVKVDRTGLTPAELGDSDKIRVGDISIAIGNPLGLEFQKSVTQGIISGLDRTIQTQKSNMTGLVQTDASINPGNSGGPLLNEKGQVIAINTAKASQGEGLGFAIPINTAKPIIEQIIAKGTFEKVTLGIEGMDVSLFEAATGTQLKVEDGVYVARIVEDTPAQKSGIQAEDIIVKVGDENVTSMTDLNKSLYKVSAGEKTTVTVNRDGNEVKLDVQF